MSAGLRPSRELQPACGAWVQAPMPFEAYSPSAPIADCR